MELGGAPREKRQPAPTLGQHNHYVLHDLLGMSEEEIGSLFRPFAQADMSHTRLFGGTGLGLHISQKLAKLLGGQVEVQSGSQTIADGRGRAYVRIVSFARNDRV